MKDRPLTLGDLNQSGRDFLSGYIESAVISRPGATVAEIAEQVLEAVVKRGPLYLTPEAFVRLFRIEHAAAVGAPEEAAV